MPSVSDHSDPMIRTAWDLFLGKPKPKGDPVAFTSLQGSGPSVERYAEEPKVVNYIQEVVSCRHNRAGIHETVPARASRDPSVGVGMISHHELKSYWHVAAGERGRTDYYYFLMMFDSCYLDHVPGQAPLSSPQTGWTEGERRTEHQKALLSPSSPRWVGERTGRL